MGNLKLPMLEGKDERGHLLKAGILCKRGLLG